MDEDARYGKEQRGDELPAELERRETRRKRIKEAQRALEERARQKAASEGSDPKQAKPKEKDQYNFNGSESRIMKSGDGFVQGYNAQAATLRQQRASTVIARANFFTRNLLIVLSVWGKRLSWAKRLLQRIRAPSAGPFLFMARCPVPPT
jgi:hypothetical protein